MIILHRSHTPTVEPDLQFPQRNVESSHAELDLARCLQGNERIGRRQNVH
jgi:hypothetical protein